MNARHAICAAAALLLSAGVFAAGGDMGQAARQPTNWTAIGMFVVFVLGTLYITKWAASKTKSAAAFYTGGGGITGFQNGLAIAGDFMSAASFLGISAAVYANGYDGLIYSIGFLVGWPVVMFLIAEPLRNLGRYTFADVVAFRLRQAPVRVAPRLAGQKEQVPDAHPVRIGARGRVPELRWLDDRLVHVAPLTLMLARYGCDWLRRARPHSAPDALLGVSRRSLPHNA